MTIDNYLAQAASVLDDLQAPHAAHAAVYPGDPIDRQPVHTVYGGAQLYKAETTNKLGELALRSLKKYAPEAAIFGRALGLTGGAAFEQTIYDRVVAKLEREAVEDFRIDFEDGYGNRPDDEEDAEAVRAAHELARAVNEGLAPPFVGIRIKPFSEELKRRSARTLGLFVSTLVQDLNGALPANFVVTLPKIPVPEEVTALVRLLEVLESTLGLAAGALKLELMIELTQSIIGPDGRSLLPQLLQAAEGRCVAAHFGTYDYTASVGITAAHQLMDHPSCDFARHMMQMAYARTGIFLSDGATNVMPVAPHRATADKPLTHEQIDLNNATVHGAWRLAYEHTRHSLRHAYYQGWDLHPAQLPVRYAANYAFFLEGFDAAAERLRNFVQKAAQATLVGDVFDDAATGQGLLNTFLRARACGAVTDDEVTAVGLTLEEIQSRSFLKILEGRRAG